MLATIILQQPIIFLWWVIAQSDLEKVRQLEDWLGGGHCNRVLLKRTRYCMGAMLRRPKMFRRSCFLSCRHAVTGWSVAVKSTTPNSDEYCAWRDSLVRFSVAMMSIGAHISHNQQRTTLIARVVLLQLKCLKATEVTGNVILSKRFVFHLCQKSDEMPLAYIRWALSSTLSRK